MTPQRQTHNTSTVESADKYETVEGIFGRFIAFPSDIITEQIKEYGAHTRNELAMLRNFIQSDDVILDIGAHIGTFAVPLIHFTGNSGKVYAFEANPETYQLLTENIAINKMQEQIIPHHGIVSSDSGSFEKSHTYDQNSGKYYFVPVEEKNENDIAVYHIDQWVNREEISSVNFIKIDVEGAEFSVLKSCRSLLEQNKPILYIEVVKSALERFGHSIEDIESLLSSLGYHFFKNMGARNSKHDRFQLARFKHLKDAGNFYDLLAIPQGHANYPDQYHSGLAFWFIRFKNISGARYRKWRYS